MIFGWISLPENSLHSPEKKKKMKNSIPVFQNEIWRWRESAYDLKLTASSVRHARGNITSWTCMAASGKRVTSVFQKQTKSFSLGQIGILSIAKLADSKPKEHAFHLLNMKTECRKTQKQAAAEGGCIKGPEASQSSIWSIISRLPSLSAKDFHLSIKNTSYI